MMNRSCFFISVISFLFSTQACAFLCPTTYNQISFGDSIQVVTEACGKPTSQTETIKPSDDVPQEWGYFVPQLVAAGSAQEMQGTLKSSFAFDQNGKLINISVNGIGVGATGICGNNIQLGDTRESVRAACGEPSSINKLKQNSKGVDLIQEIKVTEFTYNATPPVTLVFENGLLKAKK